MSLMTSLFQNSENFGKGKALTAHTVQWRIVKIVLATAILVSGLLIGSMIEYESKYCFFNYLNFTSILAVLFQKFYQTCSLRLNSHHLF